MTTSTNAKSARNKGGPVASPRRSAAGVVLERATRRREIAVLALGVLFALMAQRVFAQRLLTSLHYEVVGTRLRVTPATVAVPKGIAGSVRVELVSGDSTNTAPALAQGAHVEAVLRGPAFPARRLIGPVNEPLLLPMLSLVGDYQLDEIRLVDSNTGDIRLEGSPSSVPVHVFDEVLVSRVTSRPLSLQEIQDRGIVIDELNFRAVEFEVGFVLDGRTIPIRFPVVTPEFRQGNQIITAAEQNQRFVEAQRLNAEIAAQRAQLPDAPELSVPGLNVQLRGINFERAETGEQDLRLPIPPIPALMVIPGNIGYLNQFFSVQIFTENGAPASSGLSVFNLTATLQLPPGPDGILSTDYDKPGDDPLRFARVGANREIHSTLPLVGDAPDRLTRFFPGQGGAAEFLVEGLQEGLQVMNLELNAELEGLAAGVVKLRGQAAGSVLVRNPQFSLSFSHPRTVRAGESYEARVTLLNTGRTPANLVNVTLRGASISGGVLESPETVELGNLASGESAAAVYRIRSQRNGAITFSNLTTGTNSVQGRFNLVMAIGELGVELSPDTLILPDYVDDLPPSVAESAARVLGQALSVATAGQLPAGTRPIARNAITQRALELAEAGQRIRFGDSLSRVLGDLALDWQGGRLRSEGFDQALVATEAGRAFRDAVSVTLEAADGSNSISRLAQRAPDLAGRSEAWWIAASSSTGLFPWTGTSEARLAHYVGSNGVSLASSPSFNELAWHSSNTVASAELALLQLATNGTGQLLRWSVTGVSAGACLRFDAASGQLAYDANCDGSPEKVLVPAVTTITELSPNVVNTLQDTNTVLARPRFRCSSGPANNYGNLLAVLFSKPVLATNANVPAAYQLDDGNGGNGVRLQAGGRVALVSLNQPISALIPRALSVNGVTDPRGHAVVTNATPVQTSFRDGVTLKGRVVRADGNPAAGVPVTVTFYDPWKDPFDRCDPTVVTTVAQKLTDANGLFGFDFVHAGVSVTIAAVDTLGLPNELFTNVLASFVGSQFAAEKFLLELARSNAVVRPTDPGVAQAIAQAEGLDRAVWTDNIDFYGPRVGGELVVGLTFRGRGAVAGQVVGPDGSTPVTHAAVNLFPATDSREQGRGLFSDAQGRFQFLGVPLGQFSIQVKTSAGQFRTVSGTLERNGETNEMKIVLFEPTPEELARTQISGRVVEASGVLGVGHARVFVQHGVLGMVGEAQADADGNWTMDDVPAGLCVARAFSLDNRLSGARSFEAVIEAVAYVEVPLNGTATVKGLVLNSAGQPVANALVAGGEALVRSAANGQFTLTGVPLGPRQIQALLEARFAPAGIPRLGSAFLDVLPGLDNACVITLRPAARVAGTVRDANGDPVRRPLLNVAIPVDGGFAWVPTDPETGTFEFPNLAPGEYTLVAPAPPVHPDPENAPNPDANDQEALNQLIAAVGETVSNYVQHIDPSAVTAVAPNGGSLGFTKVTVQHDGEVVIADVQFLPNGELSGVVLNEQGVPIGAKVRATGIGIREDASVGMIRHGDRDSDPATGEFRFPGIPAGSWGLQAASPFYPGVLATNGVTSVLNPNATNRVLQFPPLREVAGRVVGLVSHPDGTPVGAGARVKINFSNDYEIRTDTNGLFDTQIKLPTRTYTVEVFDDASGLRGMTTVSVQPGITNFANVALIGKGSLAVRVLSANGQPATGAAVRVEQTTYPYDQLAGTTDGNGVLRLDNLFAGKYGALAVKNTGGAILQGRTSIVVAQGGLGEGEIHLSGTGSIRGRFVKRDSGEPIRFARVNVGFVASVTTDGSGEFQVGGLSLGNYRVVALDGVTGRGGLANVSLTTDGQVAQIQLVELATGTLRGAVFQVGRDSPVGGATVRLELDNQLAPPQTVTTGPDGGFEFAGVTEGGFRLFGSLAGLVRGVTQAGTFPSDGSSLTVNLTLPAEPERGTLTVRVLNPDGSPAAARVTGVGTGADTDGSGEARFEGLPLGQYFLRAVSRLAESSSSGAETNATLAATNKDVTVTMRLSGVGALTGQVLPSSGPIGVAGAEVVFQSTGGFMAVQRTAFSDGQGRFSFGNLPVSSYRLTARSGALAATDAGAFTVGGMTNDVTLRLGPNGTVVGRLVRADGTNILTNIVLSLTFAAPSGRDGIALATTDTEGRFRFEVIPVGAVTLEGQIQLLNGLVKRRARLNASGETLDLGDVRLDEDWPYVSALSPANGSTGVPTTTPVELLFNEELEPASLPLGGVYLLGPSGRVSATISLTSTNAVPRLVRVVPFQPLQSLTTYQVVVLAGEVRDAEGNIVGSGLTDLVGRSMLRPFVASFSTRDDDPPVLISTFPTNGAVQVDPRAVPRLSFNEPIRTDGFTVELLGPTGPVAGRAEVGEGQLTLVFGPDTPLAINSRYTLTANGVRDLAGNLLRNQPVVVTFDTLDTVGPVISALRLADGALPVAGTPVAVEAELAHPEPGGWVSFQREFEPLGLATNAPYRVPVTLPANGVVAFQAIAYDRFTNAGPVAELHLEIVQPVGLVEFNVPQEVSVQRGGYVQVVAEASTANSAIQEFVLDLDGDLSNFVDADYTEFFDEPARGSAQLHLTIDASYAAAGMYVLPLHARSVSGGFGTTNFLVSVQENTNIVVTRWKDAVSGSWSETNRWTEGVPSPTRPALIDLPGNYTVTIGTLFGPNAFDAGSIRLGGGGSTPALALKRSLTNSGVFRVLPGTKLEMEGATIRGTGLFAMSGTMNWIDGNIYGEGDRWILPGGVLRSTGDRLGTYVSTGLLENRGTIELIGNNGISLVGARLINHGTLRLANDSDINGFASPGLSDLENRGTMIVESTNICLLNGQLTFENHGVVSVRSGTLRVLVDGAGSGRIETLAGGIMSFQHNFSHGPTSELTGDGVIEFGFGTHDLLGSFTPAGEVRFGSSSVTIHDPIFPAGGHLGWTNARVNFEAPQTFATVSMGSGGTWGGSADVTVTGTLNCAGGTMNGTGRTIIDTAATMNLSLEGSFILGRPLINRSIIQCSGPSSFWIYDGLLDNQGTFIDDTSLTGHTFYGNPSGFFLNRGLYRHLGTNETFGQGLQLINEGVVQLQMGTLRLTGNSTNRGVMEVSSEAVFFFQGQRLHFEPGTGFAGSGRLRFQGTDVVFATNVNFGTLYASFEYPMPPASTGNLANTLGGVVELNRPDITFPSSFEIGGMLLVTQRAKIAGTLALLPGGTLDNRSELRVGAFDPRPGSTVLGPPPIIIGLPAGGNVTLLGLQIDVTTGGGLDVAAGSTLLILVLDWTAPPGSRCRVESTTDFRAWRSETATISEMSPGRFRGSVTGTDAPYCFFRLRLE